MKMSREPVVALVTCLMVVTGCLQRFEVVVEDVGDRSPRFRLESGGLIFGEGVEIEYFVVIQHLLNEKREKVIWRVESADKKARRVRIVKYGLVPDGFRETTPPEDLVPGGHYVAGSSMPGRMGYTEFVLK